MKNLTTATVEPNQMVKRCKSLCVSRKLRYGHIDRLTDEQIFELYSWLVAEASRKHDNSQVGLLRNEYLPNANNCYNILSLRNKLRSIR